MRKAIHSVLFTFSLLLASRAVAGVTGKIQGQVTDVNSAPLPGANVMLVGANRGAAADALGNYIILSVPPGNYDLAVQVIGYERVVQLGVLVNVDRTTHVDFQLATEAVGLEQVEVTAERSKVAVDRTFSEYIVNSEDINRSVMLKSVGDLISMEPGMDIQGRGMIRGGDMNSIAADVVYYVDGIKMVNSDGMSLHNFTGVGKYDIESLSIITGGLSAEYGNAQAGIVNIVTKEGADTFHGTVEIGSSLPGKHHWGPNYFNAPTHRDHMKWGDSEWENEVDSLSGRKIHDRIDYTDLWGQNYQVNLSGPIFKNLSFYVSSRFNRSAINGIAPTTHSPDNLESTWKLSLALTSNIFLKTGGVYSDRWSFNSGPSVGGLRSMGDNGKNVFLPLNESAAGKSASTDHMEYVALTHMLTPSTFYELRVSNSVTGQLAEDIADSTTENRKDADGWFNLGRDVIYFDETARTRRGVKLDLSSQINRNHLMKTGIDYTDYALWAVRYQDYFNDRSLTYIGKDHRLRSPIRPRQFAWYIQDKMEYEGLVVNAGIRLDWFDPNIEYPITPALAASKYYFNTFTRFDFDRLREFGLMRKIEPRMVLAPRLGVAHPITDRSMIHFFYGHIYQLPSFYTMFVEQWQNYGQRDNDVNEDGAIEETEEYNTLQAIRGFFGNPELDFEKTISFELGFDWNFVSEYVLSVSSYYKSSSNQVSSPGEVQLNWWDPASQMFDFQFTHKAGNGIHEDIQGFELSLRKSFSDYFSFSLAYNLQWAVEGASGVGSRFFSPDSQFVMDSKFWTSHNAGEDGSEEPGFVIPFLAQSYANKAATFLDSLASLGIVMSELDTTGIWSVDFWGATEQDEPKPDADIRSFGKAQIFISTPDKVGPWGLLGNLNVNLMYRMSTGTPFLYSPIGSAAYWRSAPLVTRTDLSLEKAVFQKGGARATFYIEVFNLFNQQDLRNDGGFKSIFGPGNYIRWGMEKPRPDNEEYLKYGDFKVYSRYYGSPREVKLGVRATF